MVFGTRSLYPYICLFVDGMMGGWRLLRRSGKKGLGRAGKALTQLRIGIKIDSQQAKYEEITLAFLSPFIPFSQTPSLPPSSFIPSRRSRHLKSSSTEQSLVQTTQNAVLTNPPLHLHGLRRCSPAPNYCCRRHRESQRRPRARHTSREVRVRPNSYRRGTRRNFEIQTRCRGDCCCVATE